jgi:DNA-binding transcriptional ArsR family regulator
MQIGHIVDAPSVEIAVGSGLALLVALSAAAAKPEEHLELEQTLVDVGDASGEAWLNLLGVSLDGGPPYSSDRLVDSVRELDPVELRRYLLGRYAWSWCNLAGTETIEAAARGDDAAGRALLAHPRYYAGRAPDALSTLLPLEPAKTQRRLLRAVEAGAASLGPQLDARLSSAADAAAATAASAGPLETIERLTGGYRYTPEPEAERVVLVPHVEPAPSLVLAQHRDARLIVYAAAEVGAEERLAVLGKALADPKRVEILRLLGRGTIRVSDLVEATGLTRSTVHHHLAALRQARLIDLEGNARAYRYLPRTEAAEEAAAALARVLGGGLS